MQEGPARIGDLTVQPSDAGTDLAAPVAAALAASERALAAAQLPLGPPRNLRCRDHHPVRAVGEDLETEVDANRTRHRTLGAKIHPR